MTARAVSTAIAAGLDAARDRDSQGLAEATTRLSTADAGRVAVVLGWVARALLEDLHPDGMGGEEVRAVLVGCAGAWESEVDPTALLVVLTSALGISDPDEQPAVEPAAVARNALLLVVHLLGSRPAQPYLDGALAEIRRAETVELP